MKLVNISKNTICAENLKTAENFFARLKGLLGRTSLDAGEALFINNCPSIHTFFMQFAIDVVFVDELLSVRAKYENVKPWRWLAFTGLRSRHAVEMNVGTIQRAKIDVGDQLNVVH